MNQPHLADKIAEPVGRVLGHPKVKVENRVDHYYREWSVPEKSKRTRQRVPTTNDPVVRYEEEFEELPREAIRWV